MLDVTDAQTAAGAFTNVSPNVLGPDPGAPGWGDAGVFIPYAAWLQYGDTTVVERSWPAMERWMDFILKNNPDYVRRKALGNNYADWLAPDQNTPKILIDTAYWALIAREMAEMATALHRTADAEKYQQQFDSIAAASSNSLYKRGRWKRRREIRRPDISPQFSRGSRARHHFAHEYSPIAFVQEYRRSRQPSHHRISRDSIPAFRAR